MEKEKRRGLIEGYKNLNKLTRNGALLFAFGAAAIGQASIAAIALGVAFLDQVQIAVIDKFQSRSRNPQVA
jgi:hypothetical protein